MHVWHAHVQSCADNVPPEETHGVSKRDPRRLQKRPTASPKETYGVSKRDACLAYARTVVCSQLDTQKISAGRKQHFVQYYFYYGVSKRDLRGLQKRPNKAPSLLPAEIIGQLICTRLYCMFTEREREPDTQRERERHRETETERQRQRDRDRERDRQTHTHTWTCGHAIDHDTKKIEYQTFRNVYLTFIHINKQKCQKHKQKCQKQTPFHPQC